MSSIRHIYPTVFFGLLRNASQKRLYNQFGLVGTMLNPAPASTIQSWVKPCMELVIKLKICLIRHLVLELNLLPAFCSSVKYQRLLLGSAFANVVSSNRWYRFLNNAAPWRLFAQTALSFSLSIVGIGCLQ